MTPAQKRAALYLTATVAMSALVGGGALYWGRKKEHDGVVIMNDMLAVADPRTGANIAKICMACHEFTKGAPNRIGPNLYGVVGRKIASAPGYQYSEAFQELKDITWTTDELYDFLRDPPTYAPGTRMSYGGLVDTQDRMDLISFLITLRD